MKKNLIPAAVAALAIAHVGIGFIPGFDHLIVKLLS